MRWCEPAASATSMPFTATSVRLFIGTTTHTVFSSPGMSAIGPMETFCVTALGPLLGGAAEEEEQPDKSTRSSAARMSRVCASQMAIAPAPSRDQRDQSDEKGRADDRPDHWKRFVADPDDEQLRQVHRMGEPRSEKSADEADRDRSDAAHVAVPDDRLS